MINQEPQPVEQVPPEKKKLAEPLSRRVFLKIAAVFMGGATAGLAIGQEIGFIKSLKEKADLKEKYPVLELLARIVETPPFNQPQEIQVKEILAKNASSDTDLVDEGQLFQRNSGMKDEETYKASKYITRVDEPQFDKERAFLFNLNEVMEEIERKVSSVDKEGSIERVEVGMKIDYFSLERFLHLNPEVKQAYRDFKETLLDVVRKSAPAGLAQTASGEHVKNIKLVGSYPRVEILLDSERTLQLKWGYSTWTVTNDLFTMYVEDNDKNISIIPYNLSNGVQLSQDNLAQVEQKWKQFRTVADELIQHKINQISRGN